MPENPQQSPLKVYHPFRGPLQITGGENTALMRGWRRIQERRLGAAIQGIIAVYCPIKKVSLSSPFPLEVT